MIDKAFADSGIGLHPQVETDSVASLYALMGAGEHTWLHALPVIGTTRVARLIEPDTRAQMSVAINAMTPCSVAARAFVAAATGLAVNELLDHPLTNAARGR